MAQHPACIFLLNALLVSESGGPTVNVASLSETGDGGHTSPVLIVDRTSLTPAVFSCPRVS